MPRLVFLVLFALAFPIATRAADPAALRSRLEAIAALPPSQWTDERKAEARAAFADYVALRRYEEAIRAPLSDKALKLAFSHYPADICDFYARAIEEGIDDALAQYANPESADLAEDIGRKDLARLLPAYPELRQSRHTAWPRVSKIDLDNDGVAEMRVAYREGSLGCWSQYFLKSGRMWLTDKDERCGTFISFVRIHGRTYQVDKAPFTYEPNDASIAISTLRQGSLTRVCHLDVSVSKARVVQTCPDPVCRALAAEADAFAAAPGAIRAPHLAIDPPLPSELTKFTEYSFDVRMLAVDLDNDGNKEVLALGKSGPGFWLVEKTFRLDGEKATPFDTKEWPGFEAVWKQSGCSYCREENLSVWSHGEKNYLVTFTRRWDARVPSYVLTPFLIENGTVTRIGEVVLEAGFSARPDTR